jgi:hypothetical protein
MRVERLDLGRCAFGNMVGRCVGRRGRLSELQGLLCHACQDIAQVLHPLLIFGAVPKFACQARQQIIG